MLYKKLVPRLLFLAIVALLLCDTSGLVAFVSPETCTSVSDTAPDSSCPPTCVRCGCCAQPIVPVAIAPVAQSQLCSSNPEPIRRLLPAGAPRDILHVPK